MIKIKTSKKEQEKIDTIQPLTREGRINDKFVQFYGDPNKRKREMGADVEKKIDWDRINNKRGKTQYYI